MGSFRARTSLNKKKGIIITSIRLVWDTVASLFWTDPYGRCDVMWKHFKAYLIHVIETEVANTNVENTCNSLNYIGSVRPFYCVSVCKQTCDPQQKNFVQHSVSTFTRKCFSASTDGMDAFIGCWILNLTIRLMWWEND